ncbi:MAG TPA: SDR family NAD(P)-dependent oxidoreductase [Geminicoccus sp.]|uniref:SDR family NAD(P)-dependent oxidoreductase n=1 Tax=Geminicoccus sp. TaxID=2024832 RepID=UPI002E365BBC|nr:SDR family NAD(P)-dependent oxidoreductase [Geminicoccus sp.]HEX2529548.1 SDR family NAD(P)-dependent oxidoreductase [Geminicoccus sp.]
MSHPALVPGRVAVVTGAAGGIGLAACRRFAQLGMRVCMADVDEGQLTHARTQVEKIAAGGANDVLAVPTDVARFEDVERLKEAVDRTFGDVAVLMNNAAIGKGAGAWQDYPQWRKLLEVNLFGVIHGLQLFVPDMIRHGRPGAVVVTGSKQGITMPPGNAAYNVSKAGVKVVTEQLAHELRQIEGGQMTAHLLIPGFTFTGITSPGKTDDTPKPPGAWTPDQVIDVLIDGLGTGRFYLFCQDNETTREMDERRMQWAAEDLIKDRPALSRWHPDYKDAFAAFMQG